MNIFIDNKDDTPIYSQIYQQIKTQIINGSLIANTPLPSIRNLAKDLRISLITTKRAYEELENDGYIYTIPAKGCYVSVLNNELLKEENLKKIEYHLEEIKKLSKMCNLSKEELREIFELEMEND